jgi:hypothetical protein
MRIRREEVSQMSTHSAIGATYSPVDSLWRLHLLLGAQSLVVVLVSVNRLSGLTEGYVAPSQFLRWVDLLNMLVLPLLSLIAFVLLKDELAYDSPARDGRRHRALNLLFIAGAYLLGAGYGAHEVTNYLHSRFCPESAVDDLCRIIVINDDDFSHLIFFAGFLGMNSALLLLQVLFPTRARLRRLDYALLLLNGLFIGAGIFANLAFEAIGLDLYIVALLALLALGLRWRCGPQPLVVYFVIAYGAGLAATALTKSLVA